MQALITALIQARVDFQPIKKDKVNPAFKSRYATMDAVLDAVEPALTAHGLTIVQTTDLKDGQAVLITHLFHTSGESISSTYLLPTIASNTEKTTSTVLHERDSQGRELAPMNVDTKTSNSSSSDPQKMGSAITYARRYALCAILSITADEDDDGNAASKGQQQKPSTHTPKPAPNNPTPAASKPVISGAQIGHLTKVATETGYTMAGLKELVAAAGFKTRKDITLDVFQELCTQASNPELAEAFNQQALEVAA